METHEAQAAADFAALHLGAKVSLALLASVVALALYATLADVSERQSSTRRWHTQRADSSAPLVSVCVGCCQPSSGGGCKAGVSGGGGSSNGSGGGEGEPRADRSPSLSSASSAGSSTALARQRQAVAIAASLASSCTRSAWLAHAGAACKTGPALSLTPHQPAPQSVIERPQARQKSLATSMLLAFSARANTEHIFGRARATSQCSVDALNGLRFLSMAWIIAVHTYSFALRWLHFDAPAPQLAASIYTSLASQVLANGSFACDTFLLAGGFLVAHCALSSDHKTQAARTQPLKALAGSLAHRYIRMAPLMMAIIGLSATLLRYFGSGAAWRSSTVMFDEWCRRNWWTNALFVHNFVGRENMCLSHSWYSAVDMQLFAVAQVLLLALARWPRLAVGGCLALLVAGQATAGALTWAHQLPAAPLMARVQESALNMYFAQVYIKPYCRAAPYLIGLLLAIAMRRTKLGSMRLRQSHSLIGWLVALSTMAGLVLATQPAMNGFAPSRVEAAAYGAFSRPLWALAVAWVVFACASGNCAPVAGFLGARAFEPLARLTYPAFLIHPIVIAAFYGSRGGALQTFHFSHYLMLYLTIGNLVITYAASYIMALLFELPLQAVERELRRRHG